MAINKYPLTQHHIPEGRTHLGPPNLINLTCVCSIAVLILQLFMEWPVYKGFQYDKGAVLDATMQ
jgi:hypothetical protein